MEFTNVFYQTHLCTIGGVETFLYELARLTQLNHRDLTIIYKTGDKSQIQRLKKHCRIFSLNELKKPIKCKRAFFNYGIDAINQFEADEYIQMIHADFKDKSLKNFKLIQSDKITKYYAVSENSAKSFRELTGRDISVIYNPIICDDEPRIMTLVSAQRLSPEKGGKRLECMVRALDNACIPYVWHLFSTDRLNVESDNLIYHKPTLDIRKWIAYADYTVLLSDTEGFCYGAYESLCLGTPVIITRLPILDELGVTESNSIILDFDLLNMDVTRIYDMAGKFKFKYTPKPLEWLNVLTDVAQYELPTFVTIRCIKNFYDTVEDRNVRYGEIYEVTKERADVIVEKEFAEFV